MDGPQRGAAPRLSEPTPKTERTDDTGRSAWPPTTRRGGRIPPGAAARSMTQLAQQMRDMAERMLSGGLPGWPLPGAARHGNQLRVGRGTDRQRPGHGGRPRRLG